MSTFNFTLIYINYSSVLWVIVKVRYRDNRTTAATLDDEEVAARGRSARWNSLNWE